MIDYYTEEMKDVKSQEDKIIYEWEVSAIEWAKCMETHKKIILKDCWSITRSFIIIITIACFVGFFITADLLDSYNLNEKITFILFLFVIFHLLTVPYLYLYCKYFIKKLYISTKYCFFITNNGIFTGRYYISKINFKKYKLIEDENRIEILLQQASLFGSSTSYKVGTITEWNTFMYNTKDTTPIFTMLAQFEEEGVLAANGYGDHWRLHDYLEKNKEK